LTSVFAFFQPLRYTENRRKNMTKRAILMEEVKNLPDSRVGEVLDFICFLRRKEGKRPICAAYNNAGTGTIAAIEEKHAVMGNGIPFPACSLIDLDMLSLFFQSQKQQQMSVEMPV
jgi:hypothetical protein